MGTADGAGLRVDFVPVHCYRAIADPGGAKGAAEQFYQFLKRRPRAGEAAEGG